MVTGFFMHIVKRVLKIIGIFICFPLIYLIVAIICSYIPVNTKEVKDANYDVYLSTNGVHLEIVIPKENLSPSLLNNLEHQDKEKFISFGWGDKNFYAHTPTWKDITFSTGFKALFLNTPSLLHVSRYKKYKTGWIPVKVNQEQLKLLNNYIKDSFATDSNSNSVLHPQPGYWKQDNFYTAKGSYTCFYTCNSWVNQALKQSGVKASLWTPFDFGLLSLHQ